MTTDTPTAPVAPAAIRGQIYEKDLVEYGLRSGDVHFFAPDPQTLVDVLPLGNPARLSDLYTLSFNDILDYLEALGAALAIETNRHLQEARAMSYLAAPSTPPILDAMYAFIPSMFKREIVSEMAENIGIPYLEGWVRTQMADGRIGHVRAFGARTLHIVAGNAPPLSAWTIIRNAITRGDAIIKSPSNDPCTALAIARTMIDMAPDHPLTRHLSVAYWKGGDQAFEQLLYQPQNLEKIVAWGGFSSMKHVTRYIQPGLELISLDPKRSMSIIGAQTFESDATAAEAATRLAADIGGVNQEGCVNARVIYVESGTDDAGLERLVRFGERVYRSLLNLPARMSTPPKGGIARELKSSLQAAEFNDEYYHVIGGQKDEGAIIISKLPEPVDFAPMLNNRVANLVPVDSIDEPLSRVDSYTQTIGIYPDALALTLRDRLALQGGQRITSLGYATSGNFALPQDGLEPLRRMCKWIVHEECDPAKISPPWIA